MKLDPTVLRTMEPLEFRVMEAVETGMQNHAVVPEALIASIANLRHGGAHKIVSSLLRDKLLSHERQRKHGAVHGYRLTTAGYDVLALHHLKQRGVVAALGHKIGTGKESDIYLALNPQGDQLVLKLHRLGRTSFRNVKQKRDYVPHHHKVPAHSWLFMSRLSATKEFAFLQALHQADYPTPTPVAHNRHVVAMSLVRGVPLYQILPKHVSVHQAQDVFGQAMALATRLAQTHSLVHCDLNEFNLMVDLSGIQALATATDDPYVRHSGHSVVTGSQQADAGLLSKPAWEQSLEVQDDLTLPPPAAYLEESGEPKPIVTLIDFPQMISTHHPNAEFYYERDRAALQRFFEQKLQCTIPDEALVGTRWSELRAVLGNNSDSAVSERLDKELKASGFNDKLRAGLELYYLDSASQLQEQAHGISVVNEQDKSEEEEEDEDDDEPLTKEELAADHQAADASSAVAGVASLDDYEDEAARGVVDDNDDLASVAASSIATTTSNRPVIVVDNLQAAEQLERQRLEHLAKTRVRRHLEEAKKKSRRHAAFQSRNNNKSYAKNKRVLTTSLF